MQVLTWAKYLCYLGISIDPLPRYFYYSNSPMQNTNMNMIVSNLALTHNSINATAFLAGVFLHVFVFRLGEWDTAATGIIACFSALYVTSAVGGIAYLPVESHDSWMALRLISTIFVILLAGLSTSIFIYRALFHPLRRFPGPFLARLSSAYPTSLALKRLHFFEEAQKLHAIYGDYLRIGRRKFTCSKISKERINC